MLLAHNYTRPTATFALPLVVFRPYSFIAALVCAAALSCGANGQGPQQPHRPPIAKPDVLAAPALSLGSNADYQGAVFAIETAMRKGDFSAAKQLVRLLPNRHPRIAWDDSALPEAMRSSVAMQRDKALRDWTLTMPLSPVLVKPTEPADMRISFASVLNKPIGSAEPLRVAAIFSTDASAPRLDFVIGLHQGPQNTPSTEIDIANDIKFGFGLYLGVAESNMPVGVMYRAVKATDVAMVNAAERVIAEHNLIFVEDLVTAIDAKQKVAPGRAKAFVDPLEMAPNRTVVQGEIVHFTIQVTNEGSAPMETRLVTGCSCFSTSDAQTIPPGESRLYPLDLDTHEYVTPIHKTIILLTSDPDRPSIKIAVDVPLKARYRFLTPDGDTILVGPDGGETSIYLAVEGAPLILAGDPVLSGVPGTVTIEPWSGNLADPLLGEKARPRKGYKINLYVQPKLAPGQTYVGVELTTTDSVFRKLNARLLAQRGIVAVPDTLYLGHIGPTPRNLKVVVTRPRKPFHVVGLSCSDPAHLRVRQAETPGKPWEHVVTIVFDGKVPLGDYNATVSIRTDDPGQPVLTVGISATIE